MGEIKEKIIKAWKFVSEDVWDIELSSQSSTRSFGLKTVRVLHLIFKGFNEDECPLHASALTFFTMMAIVPVLALSLALADGIGGAEAAKNNIRNEISDWTENFDSVASGTNSMIVSPEVSSEALAAQINDGVDWVFDKAEAINFTTIGGIGLLILIAMVIKVLGNVESSFNRVWGVKKGRTLWRRFTDYLSVLVVLVVLTSPPVVNLVTRIINRAGVEGVQSFLGTGALKSVTDIFVAIFSFTLLIKFMPNTKVRFKPALSGGVVGGLSFLVWLWICQRAQIGVAKYGMVYGSFAVVPIVLAWVLVSWCIVLFAAETAFAVQNCTTYRMERGAAKASAHSRIAMALSVIVEAGRAMAGEGSKFEVSAYAREKKVSVRFLNDIVDELVETGFLGSLAEEQGCFVLLKSPDKIQVSQVVDSVLEYGVSPCDLGLENVEPGIRKIIESSSGGEGVSPSTNIQDLLKA